MYMYSLVKILTSAILQRHDVIIFLSGENRNMGLIYTLDQLIKLNRHASKALIDV